MELITLSELNRDFMAGYKSPVQETQSGQCREPEQYRGPEQRREPEQYRGPEQYREPEQYRGPEQYRKPEQYRGPEQFADNSNSKGHEPITPIVIEVTLPGAAAAPKGGSEHEGGAPAAGRTEREKQRKQRQDSFSADTAEREVKPKTGRKHSGVFAFISNAIFYLAIILIMLTVLTSGTDAGVPKTIFGYSYFTVVSHSMQDEIPKGSFILVKNTDPQDLRIGDTITYMRDRSTSVTHKVVDIHENYRNSGARGFQTKGVNNAAPDSDIVHGSAIVGKVVFVLPAVGEFMAYLAANVYIVFIIFGLCVIISFCIRGILVKPKNRKQLTNEL